LSPAVFEILAD